MYKHMREHVGQRKLGTSGLDTSCFLPRWRFVKLVEYRSIKTASILTTAAKRDCSILDIKTHLKPTETFQYTHFSSSHPSGVKKGFVKGEALRLLRTNSSRTTFEENIYKFKSRLLARGYPKSLIETLLSEVKFTERE